MRQLWHQRAGRFVRPAPVRMTAPMAGSSRASTKHRLISCTAAGIQAKQAKICINFGFNEIFWPGEAPAGRRCTPHAAAGRLEATKRAPVLGVKALRFSGRLMVICRVQSNEVRKESVGLGCYVGSVQRTAGATAADSLAESAHLRDALALVVLDLL